MKHLPTVPAGVSIYAPNTDEVKTSFCAAQSIKKFEKLNPRYRVLVIQNSPQTSI